MKIEYNQDLGFKVSNLLEALQAEQDPRYEHFQRLRAVAWNKGIGSPLERLTQGDILIAASVKKYCPDLVDFIEDSDDDLVLDDFALRANITTLFATLNSKFKRIHPLAQFWQDLYLSTPEGKDPVKHADYTLLDYVETQYPSIYGQLIQR